MGGLILDGLCQHWRPRGLILDGLGQHWWPRGLIQDGLGQLKQPLMDSLYRDRSAPYCTAAELNKSIKDEAVRPPMLDEAIQDEAARPPMLDEAIQDEAAYAGRGSNAG